jgi:anti-sigma regulatory factor (Ser/Thr protein kinase)
MQHRSHELEPSTRAPAQARRYCEAACREWALDRLSTDCQLLVSELVTNAVVHGAGTISLELQHHDGALRVSVMDPHASEPLEQRDARVDDESGRGLAIVAAVAAAWGSWCEREGTQVWFELRS